MTHPLNLLSRIGQAIQQCIDSTVISFLVKFTVILVLLEGVSVARIVAAREETVAVAASNQENESDQNPSNEDDEQTKPQDNLPLIFHEKESGEPVSERQLRLERRAG